MAHRCISNQCCLGVHRCDQGHAGPVGQVDVGRRVQTDEVRPPADAAARPTSSRRSAAAPPAVAAHNASAGVKFMSRTATAMQNGMLVVYELPGLQSVASATVAPASMSRRASGYRARVENSAPGSSVATVVPRRGERFDVVVGGIGAVVHRRRAQLDARAGCPRRGRAGRRAAAGSGPAAMPAVEDVAGLVDVERAAIAEHVHPAGMRRAGRQHRRRRPGRCSRRGRRGTRRERRARREMSSRR